MICPHCGKEIDGPADGAPISVNLNNNGCNPLPVVTIIPTAPVNHLWPIGWPNMNAAAGGCNPCMMTLIKL